ITWQCLASDGFDSLENNVVFRQEHLPPCYPPRETSCLEYLVQCEHAKRMRSTSVLVLNISSRNP
ncbi:hypothetical protein Tco_0395568, partial [Tanacetum coccineum]